jgi:hypothetical protein
MPVSPSDRRKQYLSSSTTPFLVAIVSLTAFLVALHQLVFQAVHDDCPISIRQVASVWKENEQLGSFHIEGYFRISNRSKLPVRVHGLWSDCNCIGKWFETKTVPAEGHLDLSVNTVRSSQSPGMLPLTAFSAERRMTVVWKFDPRTDLFLRRQAD